MITKIDVEDAQDSITKFSDNLCLPNKEIRVSTLRIVSHYTPPDELPASEVWPLKKVKYEESDSTKVFECINVCFFLYLLSISKVIFQMS